MDIRSISCIKNTIAIGINISSEYGAAISIPTAIMLSVKWQKEKMTAEVLLQPKRYSIP